MLPSYRKMGWISQESLYNATEFTVNEPIQIPDTSAYSLKEKMKNLKMWSLKGSNISLSQGLPT